jgi:hypothetical protein
MSGTASASGVTDFDFFVGSWNILNRRENDNGVWEEFPGTTTVAQYIDGSVQIDHYEATFPSGQLVKGMSIRAFDHETGEWSIAWLSNRQRPDFRPVVGKFENGVGRFYQVIETSDGKPLDVEYLWDGISENSARWQQSFSLDGGKTWDVNWIMEFTRRR